MSTAEEEVRQALLESGFTFDDTTSGPHTSAAVPSSDADTAATTHRPDSNPLSAPSADPAVRDASFTPAHATPSIVVSSRPVAAATAIATPVRGSSAIQKPRVLTIAGTDPTGGAGIYADIKSITACGGYGMGVVTSVVAQNTQRVAGIWPQSADCVTAQLKAVSDDVAIDSVKIGMMGTAEVIDAVHAWLETTDFTKLGGLWRRPKGGAGVPMGEATMARVTRSPAAASTQRPEAEYHGFTPSVSTFTRPWTVLDPVMISTTGTRLLDESAEGALRELLTSGLIDVVTPNLPELAALVDAPVAQSWEEALEQGTKLLDKFGGHTRIYVKSGHLTGSTSRADAFIDANTMRAISRNPVITRLPGSIIETQNTHGTGCALSSALSTFRPQCNDWLYAARRAKTWISGAIEHADELNVGLGHGPINHAWNLVDATPGDDASEQQCLQRQMHLPARTPRMIR